MYCALYPLNRIKFNISGKTYPEVENKIQEMKQKINEFLSQYNLEIPIYKNLNDSRYIEFLQKIQNIQEYAYFVHKFFNEFAIPIENAFSVFSESTKIANFENVLVNSDFSYVRNLNYSELDDIEYILNENLTLHAQTELYIIKQTGQIVNLNDIDFSLENVLKIFPDLMKLFLETNDLLVYYLDMQDTPFKNIILNKKFANNIYFQIAKKYFKAIKEFYDLSKKCNELNKIF